MTKGLGPFDARWLKIAPKSPRNLTSDRVAWKRQDERENTERILGEGKKRKRKK
jgi:hypothetical protein